MSAGRLYREILRQARRLERSGCDAFAMREPIQLEQWGHGHFCKLRGEGKADAIMGERLPWLGAGQGSFSLSGLKQLIRAKFRAGSGLKGEEKEEALDHALAALTELFRQSKYQICSSVAVTKGIRIEAYSSYVTVPDTGYNKVDAQHLFAYRIRIENEGSKRVQLTGRHWQIQDVHSNVHTEVPKGSPGVVGQTPILKPGDCFEYASGTNLATSQGTIVGSFQMEEITSDGGRVDFDAEVAPFKLLR